jgi:hypothetical protein
MGKDPERVVEQGPEHGEPTPGRHNDPIEPVMNDDPHPMEGEAGEKVE